MGFTYPTLIRLLLVAWTALHAYGSHVARELGELGARSTVRAKTETVFFRV